MIFRFSWALTLLWFFSKMQICILPELMLFQFNMKRISLEQKHKANFASWASVQNYWPVPFVLPWAWWTHLASLLHRGQKQSLSSVNFTVNEDFPQKNFGFTFLHTTCKKKERKKDWPLKNPWFNPECVFTGQKCCPGNLVMYLSLYFLMIISRGDSKDKSHMHKEMHA